jgi:hypothetical protein
VGEPSPAQARPVRLPRRGIIFGAAIGSSSVCVRGDGESAFSRRRKAGSEIGRLRATYLITDGASGRRISALVVHTTDARSPVPPEDRLSDVSGWQQSQGLGARDREELSSSANPGPGSAL